MRIIKTLGLLSLFVLIKLNLFAQLPSNVLVGYHENWNTLKLSNINSNYNVICLAFALPKNYPSVGYDMMFTLPAGYGTKAAFLADIDALHAQGKKVILSIGGATGPIMLNTTTQRDIFVNSMNQILADYSYKIDGIDLDLEGSSMAFGSWTMSSPAAGQTNMVQAVKSIMANYQSQTGKKMILTAAPEVIYLMGALSSWQVTNSNGGAFLPILDGLRNEIDCLFMQLYNAGGAWGGVYAWDNKIYYDDGGIDFALAMNESVIKGFTLLSGKGTFTGLPSSKIAMGFPATTAPNAAGTGYVTPTNVCNAAKYFKGEITKPAGATYTMSASYPDMKGLMTWSINEDSYQSYPFANNYSCAFSGTAPTADFTRSKTTVCIGENVTFTDASSGTPTSWAWNFGSGASTASSNSQGPHIISYSTAGTKTIQLTATNASGSDITSKTIQVVAGSGNAGAITGATTVCGNSSQTYSITSVAGATSYTWTVPTGTIINSGQGTTSINVTMGANSGTVKVTPSNSCSSGNSSSVSVTVNPVPSAAGSITGTTSLCENTTGQTYSIASVSGAISYTWTVPTGASITAGQGTTSITVDFGTSSGNITVTPSNTCGDGTIASKAITINPVPGAAGSITGSAQVCENATGQTYSIASVNGATSYTWTVPSGASIVSGQGTNSITVDFGTTTGNVTVTPSNTCGTGTLASKAVSYTSSVGAAGTITGSSAVCENATGESFSIASVSGATTYAWTVPSGASITSGQGTTSVTVDFGTSSGNVTVTPTGSCGNGTLSSKTITLNPSAGAAGSISGNGTLCKNSTGEAYTTTSVQNASTYTWTVPAGASITSGQGTTNIVVDFGTSSGNVTVTPSNTCGDGTLSSKTVTINTGAAAAGVISGLTNLCDNQMGLTYSINAVSGATSYDWTVPSGSIIQSGQGTNSIVVDYGTTSGNVTVTPKGTCGDGASSSVSISSLASSALPFSEGFENVAMPIGWGVTNFDGSNTWTQKWPGSIGNYSFGVTCFGYGNVGSKDELFTTSISLANTTSNKLTFDHAYAWLDKGGTKNDKFDSLAVFISTDCGSTWTKLWDKGGVDLSVMPGFAGTGIAYTPAPTDFATNTIDLSAYDGESSIKLKFVTTNGNGNNIYLDNINLTGTEILTEIDQIEEFKLNAYPNPTYDRFTLELNTLNDVNLNVEMYDVSGKYIKGIHSGILLSGNHQFTIGEGLNAGVYLLRVTSKTNHKTILVTKLK